MRFGLDRREFLAGMAAATAATAVSSIPPLAASATNDIHTGYAAIPRGGNDRQAIEDISAVGFPGIQLRSNCLQEFRERAELRDLLARTGCHGATDLSPVTMAGALYFDISVANFGIQESMRHSQETDEVFPHAYSFKDGYLYPGDKPGNGVDFGEKLAAKFPHERAYLPVNRRLDGTMWNWQETS